MKDKDVVRLRLSSANRVAFEEGIDCTRVRIAHGVDGVYEIELFGAVPDALPDSGSHPLVPTD